MSRWYKWRDWAIEKAANVARGCGWEVRRVRFSPSGSAYLRLVRGDGQRAPRVEAEVRISDHRMKGGRPSVFSVRVHKPERLNSLSAWLNERAAAPA